MFVKIFTPLRTTVLTTLLIAAPAWAQQNSVVFPWNAGYPGGNQTMQPSQDFSQAPTTFPGEPTIAPTTFPQAPTIAPTTFLQPTAPLPPAQFQTTPYSQYARSGDEEQEESPGNSGRAWIEIQVPSNAEIWFEGDRTMQTGTQRQFVSPPLDRGRKFTYDVRARWTDGNGKVVDRTQKVKVEADRRTFVDFQTATPADQGKATNSVDPGKALKVIEKAVDTTLKAVEEAKPENTPKPNSTPNKDTKPNEKPLPKD